MWEQRFKPVQKNTVCEKMWQCLGAIVKTKQQQQLSHLPTPSK